MPAQNSLGAFPTEQGTLFRVWTTEADRVAVVVFQDAETPASEHPLEARGDGVFETLLAEAGPGCLYKFRLGDTLVPDPYARELPFGVHGPARVWQPNYRLRHPAPDFPARDMVIYELHIGTFTPEGTYVAATEKLPYLKNLGVNTLEIMPVSSFPGERGWGYDGVAHFAPYAPYGPPEDLMRLVDEAHALGLKVLLDIVYNHFGPDGNYLWSYSGQYFTSKHKTPWGDALDYTNPYMRRYVTDSAEHWLHTYGFDGFRLDATNEIYDDSQTHVLAELAQRLHALQTPHVLIAEDALNRPELITDYHLDGIWADDFHHQVHVLLTGENDGYYSAYNNSVAKLAETINGGWLFKGQFYPPLQAARGQPADALEARAFVYNIQNHDQVGNRPMGERLNHLVDLEAYKAASALLLFLPMTPLIFMGQEFAASSPFLYFSHHNEELGRLVSEGRREEFKDFRGFADPTTREQIPDPQDAATFERSRLIWDEIKAAPHAEVHALYQELLRLRREDPVLSEHTREGLSARHHGDVLWVTRRAGNEERHLLVNFGVEMMLGDLNPPRGELLLSNFLESDAALPRHGFLLIAGRSS
ncbi:maltooligosyltrehalose trehalohydrolase [Deinobacterium chartae]|uniref:Malto-oligosyltrehalose trehalohydrolase n=1 Tax=Deinobacterium chartae TaxID=521158 RepID=A0A841I0N3_9DEIO|nr:malto-oligosyltrehalose trehalohydrolase [Deinobacterium chartae]MBB6097535.1 maltooligosyltrehalose trehalohydrolase [Deinobacterium chartae]